MKEYRVTISTEILVDAEDGDDAMKRAFERFVDSGYLEEGYRSAMTATPVGVNANVRLQLTKDEVIALSDYFIDKDNDIEGYNIDEFVKRIKDLSDKIR